MNGNTVAFHGNSKKNANPYFELISINEITIPKNYNHNKQLSTLKPQDFCYFNEEILDKNFKKTKKELLGGKKYVVKIYKITKTISSEKILTFLKKQKALLTGAQGASILWQINREIIPESMYLLSFNDKNSLFKDRDGCLAVPYLRHDINGNWYFDLTDFESNWDSDFCFLCFC